MTDGGWLVEHVHGSPAELHALGQAWGGRLIRWCDADRPGLVLGSAHPAAHLDASAAAAAGLQVVRRHSGGSAVVVGPGRVVWADVVLPRDDPLWADDIGVAPLWLGRVWAAALVRLGVAPPGATPVVHEGAMVRGPWSALVCFAGLGPGEVSVGGRKVVGISQRRTRAGALFQVAVLLTWDPVEAVAGLQVDATAGGQHGGQDGGQAGGRDAAVAGIADVAVGLDQLVGAQLDAPGVVEDAFLAALAVAVV